MNEISYVVVFPNIFSKNKIPQLIVNIKKILQSKNLRINSIKRDNDIILVDAYDPVFASSAISLLFGIEKIAIARKIKNNFQEIVSEIVSIAGNLILKGEKYLVKVEGKSKGFLVKDIEIAATSKIIEKNSSLEAFPGTENNHNKLLYTYLTKKNGYVCIFLDKGNGGIPYLSQNKKAICAIYDEVSAISCYETIKQGYDTRIIVCYNQKKELMSIVKIINQILPRLVQDKIKLEFFQLKIKPSRTRNYLVFVGSVIEIMLEQNDNYVSLPLSPLFFSSNFVESSLERVFSKNKIPIMPLVGIDSNLFDDAKEIGLGKNMKRLEKTLMITAKEIPSISRKEVESTLKTKKSVMVKVGPNNIHDILDYLE